MTTSVWQRIQLPQFHPLQHREECDVCIVGCGLAGATAAYLLRRMGKNVIVLTDRGLGDGETAGTTAQINTAHDDSWTEMERLHGEDGARLCAESYRAAIDFIAQTVHREHIECGFEYVPGYLLPGENGEEEGWLDDELAAAHRAGLTETSIVEPVFVKSLGKRALLYPNQGQFHPLRYMHGLLHAQHASQNLRIFTETRAIELEQMSSGWRVTTAANAVVEAPHVILATNVPFHRRVFPHEALAAYRSYVVGFPLGTSGVPYAQFWDTEDPYHYVRIVPESAVPGADGPIVLVGGEDHRVGDRDNSAERFAMLEAWGKKHFRASGKPLFRWSAQTIETFDGMPLLGQSSDDEKNLWIITGDSGTGMTHMTLGAMIASEQIAGRSTPWDELYRPSRPRTRSLKRWLSGNVESAAQYRDWITPGEVSSEEEIKAECGAIMRRGKDKLAVYRDGNGELHRYSAVCPHLGAIVRWNDAEKTWDCPAHGSRFACDGKLLHGPATTALSPIDGKE